MLSHVQKWSPPMHGTLPLIIASHVVKQSSYLKHVVAVDDSDEVVIVDESDIVD